MTEPASRRSPASRTASRHARDAMRLPTRTALRDELLARLQAELGELLRAHHETLEGATHEEAKPENSKDTRALEQSYLARGQAARAQAAQRAVAEVASMPLGGGRSAVAIGAVVTVREDEVERLLFVAPQGGGTQLAEGSVHVVTPMSPLGRAIAGCEVGDSCEVVTGGAERCIEVVAID